MFYNLIKIDLSNRFSILGYIVNRTRTQLSSNETKHLFFFIHYCVQFFCFHSISSSKCSSKLSWCKASLLSSLFSSLFDCLGLVRLKIWVSNSNYRRMHLQKWCRLFRKWLSECSRFHLVCILSVSDLPMCCRHSCQWCRQIGWLQGRYFKRFFKCRWLHH